MACSAAVSSAAEATSGFTPTRASETRKRNITRVRRIGTSSLKMGSDLLVDDDLGADICDTVHLGKCGIGGAHIVKRTKSQPIKRAPFAVDWRYRQIACSGK